MAPQLHHRAVITLDAHKSVGQEPWSLTMTFRSLSSALWRSSSGQSCDVARRSVPPNQRMIIPVSLKRPRQRQVEIALY